MSSTQYVYSKQQFISDVSFNSALTARLPSGSYPRFETNTDAVGQYSGIEFGIPAFSSDQRAKIISATYTSNASDLQFCTNSTSGTTAGTRMVIDKDGNVGIGKTNPAQKLDIQAGAAASPEILLRPNNGDDAYWGIQAKTSNGGLLIGTTDGNGTITGNQLSILNSGNVGIGKTNPGAILDVNGNAIINGSINSGSISIISGCVGIGTTAPPTYQDTKLKVNGDIQCNSVFNDFTTHTFNNNTSLGNWFKIAEFSGRAYGLIELMSAWNGEHMHLRFSAGVLYNMKPFIKIISNTFLGTSIIDSIRLSLNQTSNSGCIEIKIASDGNSALATYQQVQIKLIENMSMTLYTLTTPGTTSGHTYYTLPLTVSEGMNTNGNLVITDMNGNLGIGTTTPGQKLDVNGNISTNGYMYMNSGSSYFPLDVQSSDSRHTLRLCCTPGVANSSGIAMASSFNWSGDIAPRRCADIFSGFTGTWGSEYLSFCVGGAVAEGYGSDRTERMRITAGGNVGIGTTNPGQKLDVMGHIRSQEANAYIFQETPASDFGNLILRAGYSTSPSIAPHIRLYGWNGGSGNDNVITFSTHNGERMRITAGGNVGIGTATSNYPLTVWSPTNESDQSNWSNITGILRYFSLNQEYGVYSNGLSLAISLFVRNNIRALGIVTPSDTRIKKNIVDIDDNNALSILRQIKPKTYDYVDKLQKGNNSVIGFIAQEIKEILPKAVSIVKDYVPTFYTNCVISITDVSNILLVTSPIDLSWNPLHDLSGNAFVDADGNACSDASGNKVFNVKLYDQNNNEIDCKTTSILDKRSFLIDVTGSKMVDASGNLLLETDGGYFLYGQEVDDFHALDKAAIFTVVTAAVQDIDRQVQSQAVKQQEDEVKIAALEALVAQQNQQIAQQQAQINAILAKIGGV